MDIKIPEIIADKIDHDHIIEREDGLIVCFLKECDDPGMGKAMKLLYDAYEDKIKRIIEENRIAS